MIRVKICGITNLGDALHAVEAGADALGFILWSGSKRAVAPQTAREIVAALPPFVTTVGVFVNETARSIERLRSEIGFTVAQLSGDESPEILGELRRPVVKAFRAAPDPATLARWKGASAFLADGAAAGQFGGTGTPASDDLVAALKPAGRLILAGGLTPETVAARAQAVQPYAVDVASGVEASPGVKDAVKVAAFISAILGLVCR
jgi:phosphoribosylanthranilate isomerase